MGIVNYEMRFTRYASRSLFLDVSMKWRYIWAFE